MIRTAVALLLAIPLATAAAQSLDKTPRLGILSSGARSSPGFVDAFRQGLRELGWVEGKSIAIEYRWADGRSDRLPDLAAQLVSLKVDVIFVTTTAGAVAAKHATGTIPIVMATGSDVERLGLVASFARPGGNVTGLSFDVDQQTMSKGLELLKDAIPKVRRVAVLSNPANPSHSRPISDLKLAARALGLQLRLLEARGAHEFDSVFSEIILERAGALLVLAEPLFTVHRARLVDLAVKSGLPAMYGGREYPEAGGLMSYGPDLRDNNRRAATYVDKILKGAKPADLPIEQPTKFELVINLKTAKALGLTIPSSLLLRADHVIE